MRLSPHFTLSELTTTSTGLANDPPVAYVARLIVLCDEVLEPWRVKVGPLRITSGYRAPAVNTAVGGSRTSAHLSGWAADVKPITVPQSEAWMHLVELIRQGLPVRQAILYPSAQIHVAYGTEPSPNGQLLIKTSTGFVPWGAG